MHVNRVAGFFNFFFKNQSGKQIILKNSFWLAAAQGLNGVLTFGLAVYLAREFGPAAYGQFSYALSFVMLFSTLFDFGLTTALTREFAVDQQNEQYFFDVFFLKSLLGIAAIVVIVLCSVFVSHDRAVLKMIWMLACYQLCFESLNLYYAYFRAKQKVEYEAYIRFFQMLNLLIMLAVMMWYRHAVVYVALSYASSSFLTSSITTFLFLQRKKNNLPVFRFKIDFGKCKHFLLIGGYLALAKGAGDVMVYTDSFLLGYWGMLDGVGLYNAAIKINALTLFPMTLVSAAIFPALIAGLKRSESEFFKYWNIWVKWTIFFAVFCGFFILARAEGILTFFYGKNYVGATSVLIVLTLMAVILYVGNLFYHVALIYNQQKILFYVLVCSCLANVLLNFLLIPIYGILGSAIATVCGQLINCCGNIFIASTKTNVNPLGRHGMTIVFICISSGLLMYRGLLAVKEASVLCSLFGGLLIYSFLFFVLDKAILPVQHKEV